MIQWLTPLVESNGLHWTPPKFHWIFSSGGPSGLEFQWTPVESTPPDLAEHKNYIEVMLKGGRPNKNLHSFLENDRKVLSFSIVWEDRSYDGGEKFYILNYFLSDQSIEVKEKNEQNSGRFPFPMLLKR